MEGSRLPRALAYSRDSALMALRTMFTSRRQLMNLLRCLLRFFASPHTFQRPQRDCSRVKSVSLCNYSAAQMASSYRQSSQSLRSIFNIKNGISKHSLNFIICSLTVRTLSKVASKEEFGQNSRQKSSYGIHRYLPCSLLEKLMILSELLDQFQKSSRLLI